MVSEVGVGNKNFVALVASLAADLGLELTWGNNVLCLA